MKSKLFYTVRTTRAPGASHDTVVPVLVDRVQAVDLEAVVENCIDRGLIAGLKPTAAHGIAEGVAAQIAREFSLGRSVAFGQYFYGRPYLSGTVDANGRLTAANAINVRLYKGADFKLALDDFTMSFDGAGDAVKVLSIYGDTNDAGGNTYGQIVAGAPVVINGRNLYAAGDTDKVTFVELGATAGVPVEVTAFTVQGDGILTFAWPDGLDSGKSYSVTVSRTDVNGVTRTSAAKTVAVVGAVVPPTPVGAPSIEEAQSTGQNAGVVNLHGDLIVKGQNLETATAVELCNENEEAFATVPVAWDAANSRLYAQAISYTGEAPGVGYLKVTTAGGTDSFGVEFVSA